MIRPLSVVLSACALAAQSQFRPTRSTPLPPSTSPTDATSGDVDGDGDLDLVIANDYYTTQLFLNDGRGRFTDGTAGRLTTPVKNAAYQVDLVDVDGDRDLDLLLCNDTNYPNQVHLNNGFGVFTDVSATALPPNQFWSVDQVVRDFDGDGDVDWLVIDWEMPHLYLNNGAGVFTDVTATNMPVAFSWGGSNFAADLDGDGDLDIVNPDSTSPVLLNQGGARFVFAPAGYLPGAVPGTAWAGDVDGDGRPDLFLNNGRLLLRNLGGGQFRDVSATSLPAGGNMRGTMVDADLDGDLDVVAGAVLWLNDGTGRFTAANARGPVGVQQSARLHAADLDGDGDEDLVNGSFASDRLFLNFFRQIDAPNPARIGQSFAVDMYVRPGFAQNASTVVPALAFRSVVTPLPPLGTLWLDPRSIHVLGAQLASPPAGHARFAYQIPPDPGLVGLPLHHQVVLIETLATAKLSNALLDVIQ